MSDVTEHGRCYAAAQSPENKVSLWNSEMAKSAEEKPILVILVLAGLLFVPIIFIAGLVIGLNVDEHVSLSTDTLSAWISAFATVAIAVLTFVLAKETWYLRLAQIRQIDEIKKEAIRPNLEFYLLSAPASFQFLNVHVENNGKGVARNISFSFSGENGAQLTENEQMVVDKFLSLNILRNGIVALGSSKQRTSFIFSFIDLSNKLGNSVFGIRINVVMRYEDFDGRSYSAESVVDFSEFKGISEVGGGDPLYNLYKEAEKIRKVLESAQGGTSSKRLNINTHSSADREEEKKATMEWIEKTCESAS